MYVERRFENWRIGLVHLVIVVVLPIFPIVIYVMTHEKSDNYLYILLLTEIISLIYEFMGGYTQFCNIWIKVETFTTCFVLVVMLLVTAFLLVLSISQGNTSNSLGVVDNTLLISFSVPIVSTLVEIIRCVVYDFRVGTHPEGKNNLKGAAAV